MTKFKYKPLPKGITIGNSTIEGLGLFSTDVFAPNTILGISHHIVEYEIIRTPLGGFLNHANKPNCELVENGNHIHIAYTEKHTSQRRTNSKV